MTWTTRPRSDPGGLAAIAAGAGPLVVLIHGVGLRAEAWNRQIDALSVGYRVLAFDLPGHGGNATPFGAPDLTVYTDAIAGAFDGPALVVGHSMGAMIALDLAVRHPGTVVGVAALNAIYRRSAVAARAVRARADRLDGVSPADAEGPLTRWFGETQTPERAACAAWLRATDPAGYKRAYTAFARGDAPEDAALRALECPALFMTGGQEPNSTPAMSRAMAALIRGGAALIVDDAAHMMPMTHAEAVNAALLKLAGRVFR